jgi:hypothetical protein
MANSFKKAYGFGAAFSKDTPCAPIVKSYTVAIDTAAAIDLEAGLDGYFIPAGGCVVTGDMGGTTPTIKITYGATDLMTAADPGATVLMSTVAAGVLPGTASASAKIIATAGGTSPTGALTVTVLLVPMATAAYAAGTGT